MTLRPRTQDVRRLVLLTFFDLGADTPSLFRVEEEAVMAGGGRCVGRAYRAAGLEAVWSIDKGVVRVYDAGGRLLRVVNLFRERVAARMAA